jgi:phosphatidylcholine synthase
MTDPPNLPERTSGPPAPVAWLVHLFTASGVVLALLALAAIDEEAWGLALLWLLVALAIDGVDGSLARWARVKVKAPRIDGDALDLVIDYLNYVFIPTVLIWRAGLVPQSLALWLGAAILVSSLYIFARKDMKTGDGYFRGFPALWNLVAFYLLVIDASPEAGALIVAVLVALTFAPVHFVHPFRVRDYGLWLPLVAMIWATATVALIWPDWDESARRACLIVSIGSAAALVALGLLRTLRGERKAAAPGL